jgi:hypothetical protein
MLAGFPDVDLRLPPRAGQLEKEKKHFCKTNSAEPHAVCRLPFHIHPKIMQLKHKASLNSENGEITSAFPSRTKKLDQRCVPHMQFGLGSAEIKTIAPAIVVHRNNTE